MGWYKNQTARHEAAKADPRSFSEKLTQASQDKGGDRAREGEMWQLATGETVIIRHTASWNGRGFTGAERTKVKVKVLVSGKKMEVLASQLRRAGAA